MHSFLIFKIQVCGIIPIFQHLFTILQAAAQESKRVVVFDRPNPLGKTMEGPLVDPALISFVSIASIPLRHGMTMGELAEYFNNHMLEKKAALKVVPMKDYDRSYGIADLHHRFLLILQAKISMPWIFIFGIAWGS